MKRDQFLGEILIDLEDVALDGTVSSYAISPHDENIGTLPESASLKRKMRSSSALDSSENLVEEKPQEPRLSLSILSQTQPLSCMSVSKTDSLKLNYAELQPKEPSSPQGRNPGESLLSGLECTCCPV